MRPTGPMTAMRCPPLDAAFSELFGREVAALWASTALASNCLALVPLSSRMAG